MDDVRHELREPTTGIAGRWHRVHRLDRTVPLPPTFHEYEPAAAVAAFRTARVWHLAFQAFQPFVELHFAPPP
jgi:hypothetical protein